jgi:hypothetical protein
MLTNWFAQEHQLLQVQQQQQQVRAQHLQEEVRPSRELQGLTKSLLMEMSLLLTYYCLLRCCTIIDTIIFHAVILQF